VRTDYVFFPIPNHLRILAMRLDMGRVYAVLVIETREHAMPVVTDFANEAAALTGQEPTRSDPLRFDASTTWYM